MWFANSDSNSTTENPDETGSATTGSGYKEGKTKAYNMS